MNDFVFQTDLQNLPSFSPGETTEDLPRRAAVFFVLSQQTQQILKIGSTPNLKAVVLEQLEAIEDLQLPPVKLAWVEVSSVELLPKFEQLFIQQFNPLLNGLDAKLKKVEDLNIDGWYDFQKVNGQLWGFFSNGIMPLPLPRAIALQYKQALGEQAKAISTVKNTFGQRSATCRGPQFIYSYAQQSIDELERRIRQIQAEQFVCPPGCWLSSYSVKRPYGIYFYYKIQAHRPIFPARSSQNAGKMVKTLHLGAYNSLAEAQEAAGWAARKALDRMQRQKEFLEQVQRQFIAKSEVIQGQTGE